MLTPITRRVTIVTGASRGIGRGIARAFAAQGACVLVVARDGNAAKAVADELTAQGGTASGFAGDVTDTAAVHAMAAAAEERYGGIDILCANAGIFPATRLDEMTGEQWDEVLGTNLKGTFLALSACLPAMRRRGRGRVIITSSITGPITGYPGWTHYAASKAGQLGFMRTAAMELAPSNITVNAILPGNILTEGLEALGEDYQRQMASSIPLRRLGSIADVANTALFLASDEAAYITGQGIVVDGGQVLPESLAALDAT
jgi:3-oxoacyl-[acyl-carrier protein] reductase